MEPRGHEHSVLRNNSYYTSDPTGTADVHSAFRDLLIILNHAASCAERFEDENAWCNRGTHSMLRLYFHKGDALERFFKLL